MKTKSLKFILKCCMEVQDSKEYVFLWDQIISYYLHLLYALKGL